MADIPRPKRFAQDRPDPTFSVIRTFDGHVAPAYTEVETSAQNLDPRNPWVQED
jgi:hypothetical protein